MSPASRPTRCWPSRPRRGSRRCSSSGSRSCATSPAPPPSSRCCGPWGCGRGTCERWRRSVPRSRPSSAAPSEPAAPSLALGPVPGRHGRAVRARRPGARPTSPSSWSASRSSWRSWWRARSTASWLAGRTYAQVASGRTLAPGGHRRGAWAPRCRWPSGSRFALERGSGPQSVPVLPALVGSVVGVVGIVGALTFADGIDDATSHPERFGMYRRARDLLRLQRRGLRAGRRPHRRARRRSTTSPP